MANVFIGNHLKLVASFADQARLRAFYRDVLGCTFTKQTREVDYVRFHDSFFMTVLY